MLDSMRANLVYPNKLTDEFINFYIKKKLGLINSNIIIYDTRFYESIENENSYL